MKKKNQSNPLRRRIIRQFIGEWRKYIVIFVFLALTIGFVAGMYVANYSMLQAFENGKNEYNLEDGHFELSKKASEKELAEIASGKNVDLRAYPVTIYENFYKNTQEKPANKNTANNRIRVYKVREAVNRACVLEGRLPQTENEIAIDRMHADNSEQKVGDVMYAGGKEYVITGLIALSDYSTLHEHNTDSMFDALTFDVGLVTEEGFERIESKLHYNYAWKYGNEPSDEKQEKKYADDFMEALVTQTVKADMELEDYIPRYSNQAINFAPEDMGSDEAMGGVLLYILVIVLAFVFAITVNSTITKEASVIGTLRASGYTKGELIRHYMAMPLLVTLFAALLGNVLGYTFFKNVVVAMYYNSYSLPAYETVWYYEAFIRTTVIPVILVLIINYVVIYYKLRLTPLQFLRHELKTSRNKKALRLPKFKFFRRFRLRIMLQNLPNYLVLFVGIFFVMLLLSFAFGMPSTLEHYQKHAVDQMFAKYQYILKQTVDKDGEEITTERKAAEKFAVTTLVTTSGIRVGESVTVYGVEKDSKYIKAGLKKTKEDETPEVMISSSYAEKFHLKKGDSVTLSEKYTYDEYTFRIAGIYDYMGAVTVFMNIDTFRTVFDHPKEYFNGFLSDEEITDISEDYIATTISAEDITKISRQLDHSMGGYMDYFKVACMIFAAILIYLLTKVIIEHNEKAISMVKILGYENKEITSLYMLTTTWMVVVSAILGAYLGVKAIILVWYEIMKDMDGWLSPYVGISEYIKMVVLVIIAYLIVMIIDYKRIKRIPLQEALKNME
ncbi:MAG: ABC transporter permease [Lachnospiraceae bacterium]|nr:ABC transporter permease [Lachnospiraceae bacterium]